VRRVAFQPVASPDRNGLTPRQEEIARIATELFARDGYRAVGMRSIADAVGVRTSSLYHHFPSKEDLLFAISLDVTRDFIDEHLSLLEGSGPAPQKLGALLREHIIYMARHRTQQAVSRRELRELTPDHLEDVLRHERRYQHRIQDFIADGLERGEFDVEDPNVAGRALLDLVNGINYWYREDGDLPIETLAELYVLLGLRLLGARVSSKTRARHKAPAKARSTRAKARP
jgi:AcrR family transcriptional regulator